MNRQDIIKNLNGSIVAIVTPMNDDEEQTLDLVALQKLVEWHAEEGTQAIVACGTTGESPTLSDSEWESVIRTCVKSSSLPVIAGTGTNSTRTTITRTKRALELGAHGALVVSPYYNKPLQEGLYKHFEAVAKAVPDIPIILYNVPSRTCTDILPETAAKLSQIPSIVGIKESTGKLERFGELGAGCAPGFKLYTGEDGNVVEAIQAGGHGVISVAANVMPRHVQAMCSLSLQGKFDEAMKLKKEMTAVTNSLFRETNPIPVKWLLGKMGRVPGGIRLPLTKHSEEHSSTLWKEYSSAKEVTV